MNAQSFLTGAGLAFGLVLSASPAAAQLDAAAVLPDSTLFAMGVDDIQQFADDWATTGQGRLLNDEAFAPFWAELEYGFTWMRDDAEQQFGTDLVALAELMEGGMSLALVELGPPGDDGETPAIALAALVQLSADAGDELLGELDRVAERLAEEDPDNFVLKFEDRAGIETSLLVDPNEQGEIAYGVADDTLVAVFSVGSAVETGHIDGLLAALQGEGEGALADQAGYASSLLGVSTSSTRTWLWGDLGGIVGSFMETSAALSPGASMSQAEMSEMTLDQLGTFAMSLFIEDGWMRSTGTLDWSPDFALAPLFAQMQGSKQPRAANWMPAELSNGVAMDIDLGGAFDALVDMLASANPDGMRDLVLGMASAESELGFHPRDDIIESLDGQMGIFVKEPEGGADPNDPFAGLNTFAVLVGLDDAEVMREFLDAVVRSQGLHVARERQVFEGFEVYELPVFPGTKLAYTISNDLLVLSLDGELVRDVLRRFANPELSSLGRSESYLAVEATLPADGDVLMAVDAAQSLRAMLDAPTLFLDALSLQTGGELPMVNWGDKVMRLDQVVMRVKRTLPEKSIVDRFVEGYSLTSYRVSETGMELFASSP